MMSKATKEKTQHRFWQEIQLTNQDHEKKQQRKWILDKGGFRVTLYT